MSATFAENSNQSTLEKTAEQAEEAMMETEEAPVTTEQPSPAEALALNSTGAEGPPEGAAAVVLNPDDQGTPVDDIPFVDEASSASSSSDQPPVSSSRDTADSAKPAGAEQSPVSCEIATDTSAGCVDQDKPKVAEESQAAGAKVESAVNTDEQLKAASETNSEQSTEVQEEVVQTKEAVKTEAGNVKEEEIISFDKEDGSNLESLGSGSTNRLEKLSQQIDDFDTVLESNKAAALVDVKESKDPEEAAKHLSDLTDDIIDDLIEKASNVTDLEAGKLANEAETLVLSDELTEEASNVTHLEVEAGENDAESRVNGKGTEEAMSASTESEDLAEEKTNSETTPEQIEQPKTKTQADNTVKTDTGTKKIEEKKTEHSSPVKTAKSKKKEDKSIEHILKALSSLQTTEEKLAALCKKYADLHEDHRVLQTTSKQNQRKLTVISREKDQLQTEHTKAVMAKSKLESLCRELQKHNQTIRQESLQRAKEEDEKRKEISQKFQTTIGEIQQQMQENHDRNKQLREENFELANKLKKFIEQYEAREKQVEKVIQHRELEQKLADAKLEQASAILMEEKARSQKDKEILLIQSAETMKKIQLKDAELKMYKERYEEFQSTIKRSEEMFNKFKTEMDKMTKRCKKLDKETAQWKGKWENANRALLEMAEEKQRYDKEKTLLMTKITKLESLCRAMQAERKARKLLENEGVDMSKLTLGDSTPPLLEPQGDPNPEESAPTPSPVSVSPTPVSPVEQECVGKSTIEDIDEDDDDDDSDLSSASETTGDTVIQPDSQAAPPPDTSQSECTAGGDSQSDSAKQVIDQSEAGTEQTNQSGVNEVSTAS